jgi:Fur family ferric uptake transcriptional regulator
MDASVAILKANGLNKTKIREKVLDLFLGSAHALSLSEIESSFEKLNRVTLYRTLKTFQKKGIIRRTIDGTKHPKFVLCKSPCDNGHALDKHLYFHCTSCENTFCLDHLPIPNIQNLPRGYNIQETNFILMGTCPDCK